MDEEKALTLVGAGARLDALGLVSGAEGNLSASLNEGYLITPSGVSKAALKPAELILLNAGGSPLEPAANPSVDTLVHLAVYAERGPGYLFHTHPTALVAGSLTMEGGEHEGFVLVEDAGLGTPEQARIIAEAARTSSTVVVRGHGVYAHGTDPDEITDRTVLLERRMAELTGSGV